MSHLYPDSASGVYRVLFRLAGKQYHKSLKTKDQGQAEAWAKRIEATIHDLERGRLILPPGADLWEFLKSDGQREKRLEPHDGMTLAGVFDWHHASCPEGAKESNTARTERIHANHLMRLLGKRTRLESLSGQDLQEKYVNVRAKDKHHGRQIKPETIRKEIASLKAAWRQAFRQGLVKVEPPTKGLRYPKGREKPPFQTWGEIEKTIAAGGLTDTEQAELWHSLYLDVEQVKEVLEFVRGRDSKPSYLFPLLVFVAHTGARRSEAIRARVTDFRFEDGGKGTVLIREKKKDRSKEETVRRVDMSPLLKETMQQYFSGSHPGGSIAFCSKAGTPLSVHTLHSAFKACFDGSKWSVLRGYHVFRHSFASNLARQNVDQRVIDELMGHHTVEMQRRYRHLFPEQRANAIARLFA